MEYTLIRSKRKTLALQVKADGTVVIRAPQRLSLKRIETFVSEHESWIEKTRKKVQHAVTGKPPVTDEMRRIGIEKAKKVIPQKVAYFAGRMGVIYGRITIREQKTRWGSCSSAGNLNFNWKLMLLPEDLLDYVVVHELAHRREMNHSADFWAVVEAEMPDYKERRKRLKQEHI